LVGSTTGPSPEEVCIVGVLSEGYVISEGFMVSEGFVVFEGAVLPEASVDPPVSELRSLRPLSIASIRAPARYRDCGRTGFARSRATRHEHDQVLWVEDCDCGTQPSALVQAAADW
jgi:hypothetical protein